METALLPNDPDNDRPGLYLALVSLTDLTVVAVRESHKQSWQSLDKHVMTALCRLRYEPWSPETDRVGGICEGLHHMEFTDTTTTDSG